MTLTQIELIVAGGLYLALAVYAAVAATWAIRADRRCVDLEVANERLRQPCPRCAAARELAARTLEQEDAVLDGADSEGGEM